MTTSAERAAVWVSHLYPLTGNSSVEKRDVKKKTFSDFRERSVRPDRLVQVMSPHGCLKMKKKKRLLWSRKK